MRPDPNSFVRSDAYREAEQIWDEQYNALVWDPRLTYGAICISHEGVRSADGSWSADRNKATCGSTIEPMVAR
jgi:hypothetical protein